MCIVSTCPQQNCGSWIKKHYGFRNSSKTKTTQNLSIGPFLWCKALDDMTLFFRKYDFIWPKRSHWVRTYIYCTKKHYQQKQA